jgi:uncharacterized protein (TIGR03083 family)
VSIGAGLVRRGGDEVPPAPPIERSQPMSDTRTWELIHAERASVADDLAGLAPDQWTRPSLCAGWSVQVTAGHILAAAEQTKGGFARGMVTNGFRFNRMMDREARRFGSLPPTVLIDRLRARTSTTNRPPAPVVTMLGEVVVHAQDIRRPLGITTAVDPAAVIACLDSYKTASFPLGGKARVAGLRLVATDLDWSHGEGPEVRGDGLAVLLAMAGRPAGVGGLDGPGAATLGARMS